MGKDKDSFIRELAIFFGKGFLYVIGIMVFILVALTIIYWIYPSYDMNCLNMTAMSYCNSINMSMVPMSNDIFQDNYFVCRDRAPNEERDGYVRAARSYFLSSEMSACKIKVAFTFNKIK